jgi:ADP-ribosyl-[dinitrogen reductase] hydrolase
MDPIILDRISGVAVGAAVGDALGMPLEFGPARPLDRLVRDMVPGRLLAGSFTDDTEMALALGESLLAQRPLDGADLAQRFLSWYRTHPPDVGVHISKVLGQIARDVPWETASQSAWQANPDNAGNGSLMRSWPAALANWQDPARLVVESTLQSQVTHFHPECIAASVLVNSMIANLIAGQSPAIALQTALDLSNPSAGLRQVALAALTKQRTALPNSGWVRHTLESALWGLFTTDSFEEALVQVANLGSDADTAAAVVGALAGARYGLSGIPTRWRVQLQGQWPVGSGYYWREADFIRLAYSLAGC